MLRRRRLVRGLRQRSATSTRCEAQEYRESENGIKPIPIASKSMRAQSRLSAAKMAASHLPALDAVGDSPLFVHPRLHLWADDAVVLQAGL